MTKQEAAALLRRTANNETESIWPAVAAFDAIADLLEDPPREGLVKVQIALAWDEAGSVFDVSAFGAGSYCTTSKIAFADLADGEFTLAPTVITAYVPRPDRTVAQVEGEVEG